MQTTSILFIMSENAKLCPQGLTIHIPDSLTDDERAQLAEVAERLRRAAQQVERIVALQ
jgi:hypothetical protein